jgi:hypothetical protein
VSAPHSIGDSSRQQADARPMHDRLARIGNVGRESGGLVKI